MNGLTLRVSNSGGKKSKNRLKVSRVDVSEFISDNLVKENPVLSKFVDSKSTDEQLVELKNILDSLKDDPESSIIQFLTVIFFEAESKHPVKCFLVRHISRNPSLGVAFTISLAAEIAKQISRTPSCYKEYAQMVSKLSGCLENFAQGASALEAKEIEVIGYLDSCLRCCIDTLKNSTSLSPTAKNEIFNLSHSALRILLHIYSHSKLHEPAGGRFIKSIKLSIQQLLFDDDVPMDTKSVCGILYLNLLRLENGTDFYLQILKSDVQDGDIEVLMSNIASQLSLYSAIATVLSVDTLQFEILNGNPVLLVLVQKILNIGDSNSSDSVFVLGVTRTLLQISKGLDKITNSDTGLALMDNLLSFIWSHLEHHMDSVRHLSAQMLTNVVKYCSKLDRSGDTKPIENLFAVLKSLDKSRKSFYVTLTALIADVGAIRVTKRLPVMHDVMAALSVQAVQATATTTLEVLLQQHVKECTIDIINVEWIEPILHHVTTGDVDNGVLNILENILIKAVKLNQEVISFIIPHIKRSDSNLKCILMLVSVVRKASVTNKQTDGEWRGIIDYHILEEAAVDVSEETRVLALSLVVESPKSTEAFTEGELKFVLNFLRYNANGQSPNFRQLILSMMKKFMKRLEDSYKVLKRQKNVTEDVYITFLEDLRAQCFNNLLPGANYSRRVVSLQILVWSEKIDLCGYERVWTEIYVEKLLQHLEDSYENNKAYALEVLDRCPTELLKAKTYSTSSELNVILKQASSMKPTDCVTAAYKLDLLRKKLPERILEGGTCNISEAVIYTLLRSLHEILCKEQDICQKSIVRAAVNAPMYGVIHCMVHFMEIVDVVVISSDQRWSALISDIIDTCIKVNSAVECVVNNSSPEGHLPMDMGGVKDHGNESGIILENGRQVTAQMVLLCAWRSVKEVSLLLGEISSRLSIQSEHENGTLTVQQMVAIGEHFTKMLAETKHRGAFEQAYVGFTKLLARLWRCRNPELHSLPRIWLSELMEAIATGDKRGSLCATRRSAGLPFMIQALVTTELQVQGNPKCFHECMTTLLRLARSPTNSEATTETAVETRTHSINILRALFRNSALDESVSGYVGDGLMVALEGFEGSTWMERNSSTLLFSALTVRVFGVQRSKDTDNLCIRNRMTGRIFFLRYPQLYDFMLDKLKEVTSDDDTVLRPSLYPVLLLLARLYPSSLEGTVSNLKLVTFIPHVLSCSRSGVLKTRQLAAKAMVALVPPEQYLQHVEDMLDLIQHKQLRRNYCHGILLQLIRLLDYKPESLTIYKDTEERLSCRITRTMWILEQALSDVPCWLLLDEYVKMINLLVWRFPNVITEDIVFTLNSYLHKILFHKRKLTQISSGKDVSLHNALYLYLIILNKYEMISIFDVILKSLNHDSYEVKLAVLNFILNLYDSFEHETKLEEHLVKVSNRNVLGPLREGVKYQEALCEVFKNNKYQECKHKCLKVLSLMDNKERLIVEMKVGMKTVSDDIVINTLIDCVKNEHENLTHIYLDTLCNFVKSKLLNSKMEAKSMLEVLKLLYSCISSDNNYDTRSTVLKFYENYYDYYVLNMELNALDEVEKFEFKVTPYATIVTSLEDDDDVIRHRTSYVIARTIATQTNTENFKVVSSSKSAEMLRNHIARNEERHGVAILLILALLDFKSEVCLSGDVNDECRVFDQNERYNIFLEETIWTMECADKILQILKNGGQNIPYILNEYEQTSVFCNFNISVIKDVIKNPVYRNSIEKLCVNNFVFFEKLLTNCKYDNCNLINPKVRWLFDKLLQLS